MRKPARFAHSGYKARLDEEKEEKKKELEETKTKKGGRRKTEEREEEVVEIQGFQFPQHSHQQKSNKSS